MSAIHPIADSQPQPCQHPLMCNLYRHRVERWELLATYGATEDPRQDVAVEKRHPACGSRSRGRTWGR
jgi:hypothetical protein